MPGETSWTLVRDAAAGDARARDRLTDIWLPPVRAYLTARWRGSNLIPDVDDVVQDVFVDLLKEQGALQRVEPERGRFRAFVYGVARNAARNHEARRKAPDPLPSTLQAAELTASRAFDAAWAQRIMTEAVRNMRRRSKVEGGELPKRVAVLEARFDRGLPIREIATEWQEEVEFVHRLYRRARQTFEESLREVVAVHSSCPEEELADECRTLASLLRGGEGG